jgi:beta-lactamase class A
MKALFILIFPLLLISQQVHPQNIDTLRQRIQKIVTGKNALVGVSIHSPNSKDTLSINGNLHFPLQSVFKFHIAIVVLSLVDQGKFSLDQLVDIQKKELPPSLYSPIRDAYPNGTKLSLSKILEFTVSLSDNVGCDVLLKLIGGPKVVEDYFKKNKIKDPPCRK